MMKPEDILRFDPAVHGALALIKMRLQSSLMGSPLNRRTALEDIAKLANDVLRVGNEPVPGQQARD